MPVGHLIWWSTNTRACSLLLNESIHRGVATFLVIDESSPPPPEQALNLLPHSLRKRGPLEREELEFLVATAIARLQVAKLVIAPTSEYLIKRVKGFDSDILRTTTVMPPLMNEDYSVISDKEALYATGGSDLMGFLPAAGVEQDFSDLPFFAKPRRNLDPSGTRTLKPFLVKDIGSFEFFEKHSELYFSQEIIVGPSFYFCGFAGEPGKTVFYFQRNLLQVPGGGSIALAIETEDPGAKAVCESILRLLARLSFRGPFMVELKGTPLRIIEINPRFWGPLLLDRLRGGAVLNYYFEYFLGSHTIEEKRNLAVAIYYVPSLLPKSLPISSDDESLLSQVPKMTEEYERICDQLGGDW